MTEYLKNVVTPFHQTTSMTTFHAIILYQTFSSDFSQNRVQLQWKWINPEQKWWRLLLQNITIKWNDHLCHCFGKVGTNVWVYVLTIVHSTDGIGILKRTMHGKRLFWNSRGSIAPTSTTAQILNKIETTK